MSAAWWLTPADLAEQAEESFRAVWTGQALTEYPRRSWSVENTGPVGDPYVAVPFGAPGWTGGTDTGNGSGLTYDQVAEMFAGNTNVEYDSVLHTLTISSTDVGGGAQILYGMITPAAYYLTSDGVNDALAINRALQAVVTPDVNGRRKSGVYLPAYKDWGVNKTFYNIGTTLVVPRLCALLGDVSGTLAFTGSTPVGQGGTSLVGASTLVGDVIISENYTIDDEGDGDGKSQYWDRGRIQFLGIYGGLMPISGGSGFVPGNGIVIQHMGEMSYVDHIWCGKLPGHGIVHTGFGSPVDFGKLSLQNNGRAGDVSGAGAAPYYYGLLFDNSTTSSNTVDFLAGDNNQGGLMGVDGLSGGSVTVRSWKAERWQSDGTPGGVPQHNVVFRVNNPNGGVVDFGNGRIHIDQAATTTTGYAVIQVTADTTAKLSSRIRVGHVQYASTDGGKRTVGGVATTIPIYTYLYEERVAGAVVAGSQVPMDNTTRGIPFNNYGMNIRGSLTAEVATSNSVLISGSTGSVVYPDGVVPYLFWHDPAIGWPVNRPVDASVPVHWKYLASYGPVPTALSKSHDEFFGFGTGTGGGGGVADARYFEISYLSKTPGSADRIVTDYPVPGTTTNSYGPSAGDAVGVITSDGYVTADPTQVTASYTEANTGSTANMPEHFWCTFKWKPGSAGIPGSGAGLHLHAGGRSSVGGSTHAIPIHSSIQPDGWHLYKLRNSDLPLTNGVLPNFGNATGAGPITGTWKNPDNSAYTMLMDDTTVYREDIWISGNKLTWRVQTLDGSWKQPDIVCYDDELLTVSAKIVVVECLSSGSTQTTRAKHRSFGADSNPVT